MPSLLGHALLGLLARRALTGYDLAKRMERPVGYFWSATHSQIYPELARLEAEGLVAHEVIEGAGPRPTKRYAVTPAGRAAHAAWVAGPQDRLPMRDLESLVLFSLWLLAPEEAAAVLRRERSRHAERLAVYEAELADIEAGDPARRADHPDFASRITVMGGIHARAALVGFYDWALGELERAGEAEARAGSADDLGGREPLELE